MKSLADDKIDVTQKLKFVLRQGENISGKGENAGYQHFLLFQKCFQQPHSLGPLKVGIVHFSELRSIHNTSNMSLSVRSATINQL